MLAALLGYLGHGAQAHIAFSEGETVSVLICGQGGHRTVEMTLGNTEPPEDTKPHCCDDCTHASDAMPTGSKNLGGAKYLPIGVLLQRQGEPIHPGGPLWPGAPPNGPPFLT
ncbi:MAG: hypothetical protein AAF292_03825 [Pseudomonadota bacterium]